MSQYFDKPKFTDIVQYFLNWSCDMEAQLDMIKRDNDTNLNHKISMAELTQTLNNRPQTNPLPISLKKPMRLIIIELIPTVLVSDGHNFMEAIFTKESINDLRKYYSHVKFSNLRDKIIQVGKWSLQIDSVDSKEVFNSYQNLTIKLVIEQFKPQIHEILNQRLTHGATSLFRSNDIQARIRNYRHWFAQTMICKNYVSEEMSEAILQPQGSHQNGNVIQSANLSQKIAQMPSLSEIFGGNNNFEQQKVGLINCRATPGVNSWSGQKLFGGTPASTNNTSNAGSSKGKTMKQFMQVNSHSHNSQNTTQLSDNDHLQGELSQQHFGAIIQKSQVFRCKVQDFQNIENTKLDSDQDLPDYYEQVALKKSLQSKDIREADIVRIVIQEKGEQYYAEKKFNKSRQWQEQVEDEYRREQLKIQIEYFQVGQKETQVQQYNESAWQRDEREKALKRASGGYRSSRRIIGYTLGFSAASIKEKLVKMLQHSKRGAEAKSKSVSSKCGLSPPKGGGRQRANSQENILIIADPEDGQTQMQCIQDLAREPLSQFVINHNSVYNDDTQSEQDSIDAQINDELAKERENSKKLDNIESLMEQTQPVLNSSISLFREYLDWFQQKGNDLQKVLTENEIREQEMIKRQKREADAKHLEELKAQEELDKYVPRKSNRLRNRGASPAPAIIKVDEDTISAKDDDDENANPLAQMSIMSNNDNLQNQDKIMHEQDQAAPLINLDQEEQILQSHSENQIMQIDHSSNQINPLKDFAEAQGYGDEGFINIPRPLSPQFEMEEMASGHALPSEQNTLHQRQFSPLDVQSEIRGNNIEMFQNDGAEDILQLDDNTLNNDSNNVFNTNSNQYKAIGEVQEDQFQQNNNLLFNQNQINTPQNLQDVSRQQETFGQDKMSLGQLQSPAKGSIDVDMYYTPEKIIIPQLIGQDEEVIEYMQISDKKLLNSDQMSIKSEPMNTLAQEQNSSSQKNNKQLSSSQKYEKSQDYQTPQRPVLDVEFRLEPPKPLDQMSPGEKAMFEYEREIAQMQAEMEEKQRKMQEMLLNKQMMAQKLKEEAEAKLKEEEERRQREERERVERERIEALRIEQERLQKLEEERLRQLEEERLERERIEQQRVMRIEQERIAEQERLAQIERQRQAQIEAEQIEKERQRRVEELLAAKIKKEQERRRLEKIEQEKKRQMQVDFIMNAIKQRIIQAYNQQYQLQLDIQAEIQRQQQKKAAEIEKQNRIKQEIAARIELERQEEVAQAMIGNQNNFDELDWGEGSNDDDEENEMNQGQMDQLPQQQNIMQMQGEQNINSQTDSENMNEESREEYNDVERDEEILALEEQREKYINKMSSQFEHVLNQAIRKNETKDLNRRKIKRTENDDKLYDFMKIQEIKNQKQDKNGIFRRHDQIRQSDRIEIGNAQNYNEEFEQIQLENDQVDELDAKYLNQDMPDGQQEEIILDSPQHNSYENVENQFNLFDQKEPEDFENNKNLDVQMDNDNRNMYENTNNQQQYQTESYSEVDEEEIPFHQTIQDSHNVELNDKNEDFVRQESNNHLTSNTENNSKSLKQQNEYENERLDCIKENQEIIQYEDDVQDNVPQNKNEQLDCQQLNKDKQIGYKSSQENSFGSPTKKTIESQMNDHKSVNPSLQTPPKGIKEVIAYTEATHTHQNTGASTLSEQKNSKTQALVQDKATPAGEVTNDAIQALQAQILALTNTVSMMSQQLYSQQQTKQGPSEILPSQVSQAKVGSQNEVTTEQEGILFENTQNSDEYHVPVFGSQMKTVEDDQPVEKTTPSENEVTKGTNNKVQPFTLNNGQNKKRNFTQQQQNEYQGEDVQPENESFEIHQHEGPSQKHQRISEGQGPDDRNGANNFKNLEEFINYQRMKNHKDKIIEEFNKRDHQPRRGRNQVRNERGGVAGQNQQQSLGQSQQSNGQNLRGPRHSSQQRPLSSGPSNLRNPNFQQQQIRQRGQSQEKSQTDSQNQIRRMPPQENMRGGQQQMNQGRGNINRNPGMQQAQRPVNQQIHGTQHVQMYGQYQGQNLQKRSNQTQEQQRESGQPGQGSSPQKRSMSPQQQQMMQKRGGQMNPNSYANASGHNQGHRNAQGNQSQIPPQNPRAGQMNHGRGTQGQDIHPNGVNNHVNRSNVSNQQQVLGNTSLKTGNQGNQMASGSNMIGGTKRYIHSQQPGYFKTGQGNLKEPASSAQIQSLYQNVAGSFPQQQRQQKNISPRKQFVQNGVPPTGFSRMGQQKFEEKSIQH